MRYVLDPPVLRETGAALRVVAVEFANANAHSDVAAAAVGHDELGDRVRDFARQWDDRRAKMLDTIGLLAEAATGIGDGVEQLDDAFAAGLRGQS